MIERVLRWAAISVVVAAIIDPAVTVSGRARARVSVIVQTGPSMSLPAPGSMPDSVNRVSRSVAAGRVYERLAGDLREDFELVSGADAKAAATVVIGDRYPDETLAESANVSTVSLAGSLTPNVRIVSIDAPRAVPPATTVRIDVDLDATGVRGSTTAIAARAGDAEVGRVSHTWTLDREQWRASLDVVPVGEPPWQFVVDAEALTSEQTAADNRAIVSVDRAPVLRAFVLEARPSWATTFVRRALEGDPRFDVSGRSQAAPRTPVSVGVAPTFSGSSDELDRFDVLVVGGLDGLSRPDKAAIERFMTERGGSVALIPDTRLAGGPARDLLGGVSFHETLLDRPAVMESAGLPRIDASELLESAALPAGSSVLARSKATGPPIVWVAPHASGRLLFSGAMDAWRFRADARVEFDRFWRSVMSGLALAAQPRIALSMSPDRPGPGQRVRVVARVRDDVARRIADGAAMSARIGSEPVRLWPDAASGEFFGTFLARPHSAPVVVRAGEHAEVSVPVVVDDNARESVGPPLALLAATHQGVDVKADGLSALERHLRATVAAAAQPASRHPMRSAWWMIPFAACLSGEWWMRRRRGAR
jgi:hypothetical protein